MILNEYDVAHAVEQASRSTIDRPNLLKAAAILARLVEWTNDNSDGWPYWVKPRNASSALQEQIRIRTAGLIGAWDREPNDITTTELKVLVRPVKAFLTRHAVDPAVKRRILGEVA
jgi:hypothetical protein